MVVEDDPGDANVTDETRAFEQEDEQVFRGAGRGPTPEEDEAAERADPVSDETREAYQSFVERGAHVEGEGRI